ncbi:C40 family peptidase [Mycobacterium kyorinense]|uniref:C40 family peptidase n=1 Tax=Mycobacterium kyorinense TaxID=487514 RepID=UPI00136350C3|nr:NlpC/P60 family protein [Mycobacterium kyorinense]
MPGPHEGDPGYKTGLTPTLAGSPGDHPPMHVAAGSSDQVRLQDNPPGYNGPAGAPRDAAWQAYLSQQNGSTTGKVDPKTLVLPNPDAVSDPGLKTLGAAAKQQGVSYAWGGGHDPKVTGVTRGHQSTAEEVGRDNIPDQSWTFHDNNRTGFDCSGLARFATESGHGFDMGSGNTVFQERALPGHGAVAVPDSALRPGDIIYYGPPGDSNHVAIYAGNGLMIQAAESGEPVEVSPMRHDTHRNYHIGN